MLIYYFQNLYQQLNYLLFLFFLLISYSLLGSALKVFPDASLKGSIFIVLVETLTILTIPVPATFSSFLKSISTSSPTLILDLSISLVNKTKLFPLILLT